MKTILVVDDNSILRETVVEYLRSMNYRVLEAENGEKGLDVLMDNSVDLVFTDVIMPGKINSVDMIQCARDRLGRAFKVLYTTGYPAVDVGPFAEVIQKPYSVGDLYTKIEQLLRE